MNILYGKNLTSRFNTFIDKKDTQNTKINKDYIYPQQSNITYNIGKLTNNTQLLLIDQVGDAE